MKFAYINIFTHNNAWSSIFEWKERNMIFQVVVLQHSEGTIYRSTSKCEGIQYSHDLWNIWTYIIEIVPVSYMYILASFIVLLLLTICVLLVFASKILIKFLCCAFHIYTYKHIHIQTYIINWGLCLYFKCILNNFLHLLFDLYFLFIDDKFE